MARRTRDGAGRRAGDAALYVRGRREPAGGAPGGAAPGRQASQTCRRRRARLAGGPRNPVRRAFKFAQTAQTCLRGARNRSLASSGRGFAEPLAPPGAPSPPPYPSPPCGGGNGRGKRKQGHGRTRRPPNNTGGGAFLFIPPSVAFFIPPLRGEGRRASKEAGVGDGSPVAQCFCGLSPGARAKEHGETSWRNRAASR
jgi:hypothetical protein